MKFPHNTSTKKILILAALVLFFLTAGILRSTAQQTRPQFLITWRAESYAPPQFEGKILPTANSPITASFELFDGGGLVDLSKQTIHWYINNRLVGGGRGVQTIKFIAPSDAPDILGLRIQIPEFPGGFLLKVAQIPIVRPEAVIEAPYPDGQFSNVPLTVKGTPYFFNVKDPTFLSFVWSVNRETPQTSESPSELVVDLNPDAVSGSSLNIGLTIQNPANRLDSSSSNITLTLIK